MYNVMNVKCQLPVLFVLFYRFIFYSVGCQQCTFKIQWFQMSYILSTEIPLMNFMQHRCMRMRMSFMRERALLAKYVYTYEEFFIVTEGSVSFAA